MGSRPVIIHADDLGLSRSFNAGIRDGATRGLLTSTCVRMNGAALDEAVNDVLPQCPALGVGLHLNIVEGRTTRPRPRRSSSLCDRDGRYRLGFPALLARSRERGLLDEIECDYRDQIERALLRLRHLDHINSHQHSHAVPALFALVCRLAGEYGIPWVRLPREPWYRAGSPREHVQPWFAVNLLKAGVLNALATVNRRTAREYRIPTNEWLIGVAYTGRMRPGRLLGGLDALPEPGTGVVEVLVHPCRLVCDASEQYLDSHVRDYVLQSDRVRELEMLLDPVLRTELEERLWMPTCYGCLTGGFPAHDHGTTCEPLALDSDATPRVLLVIEGDGASQGEFVQRIAEVGKRFTIAAVMVVGHAPGLRAAADRSGVPVRVCPAFDGDLVRRAAEELGAGIVVHHGTTSAVTAGLLETWTGVAPQVISTTIGPGRAHDGSIEVRCVRAGGGEDRTVVSAWIPRYSGDTARHLGRLSATVCRELTMEALTQARRSTSLNGTRSS